MEPSGCPPMEVGHVTGPIALSGLCSCPFPSYPIPVWMLPVHVHLQGQDWGSVFHPLGKGPKACTWELTRWEVYSRKTYVFFTNIYHWRCVKLQEKITYSVRIWGRKVTGRLNPRQGFSSCCQSLEINKLYVCGMWGDVISIYSHVEYNSATQHTCAIRILYHFHEENRTREVGRLL